MSPYWGGEPVEILFWEGFKLRIYPALAFSEQWGIVKRLLAARFPCGSCSFLAL